MFDDLRGFLAHLEDLGQLKTVKDEVSVKYEIAAGMRKTSDIEGPALEAADVKFEVSFLFGGQIKGEKLRLYMIYAAGNFIECTTDTPYLQIGEHKYGKPVLDRAMHYDVELYEALKTGLISMDSTMRSNLGVGLPIALRGRHQPGIALNVVKEF